MAKEIGNKEFAYWLPFGIPTSYDQKMVEECILLFCAENLAE